MNVVFFFDVSLFIYDTAVPVIDCNILLQLLELAREQYFRNSVSVQKKKRGR